MILIDGAPVDKKLLMHLLEATLDGQIDKGGPDLRTLGIRLYSPLYRGLPYPKAWLTVGGTIEQRGDCSHWSTHYAVAREFAKGMGDKEFIKAYGEDHGIDTLEKSRELFEYVVLELKGAQNAIQTGDILAKVNAVIEEKAQSRNPEFESAQETMRSILAEREVTIYDSQFVIEHIGERAADGIVKVTVRQEIIRTCPETGQENRQ